MEKKLIKSGYIWLNNIKYDVKFFQTTKLSDQITYSFEIIFDSYDKIIIDDEDLSRLEKKICSIVPIAYHCRTVAKMTP